MNSMFEFDYITKNNENPKGMAGARKTVKPKFNYFTASVRRGWLNKS